MRQTFLGRLPWLLDCRDTVRFGVCGARFPACRHQHGSHDVPGAVRDSCHEYTYYTTEMLSLRLQADDQNLNGLVGGRSVPTHPPDHADEDRQPTKYDKHGADWKPGVEQGTCQQPDNKPKGFPGLE